jgi:glycosyltransferase involved in cell wall biosynthesis
VASSRTADASNLVPFDVKRNDVVELSVVVPTRNEAGNVTALLERLSRTLDGRDSEILFVDDSDDDTCERIASAAEGASVPVRVLHRDTENRSGGLGGAVLAGLLLARGAYVCVMDADLQHPPEIVTQLLDRALGSDAPDIVVGSRYQAGGSTSLRGTRAAVSWSATAFAKALFPKTLREVSDPMSGFFLVRRDSIDVSALRPNGFKILVEILARHRDLHVVEVPFVFADREWGNSKADIREGTRFGRQLIAARTRAARRTHCYDIHGIISVASDAVLPELEYFRVNQLREPATIRVHLGTVPPKPHVLSSTDESQRYFHFREVAGSLGFAAEISIINGRVVVNASSSLRFSPHVLYTNLVEPLLRWTFVERGYALVHAAVVVKDAQAFLITALTDTGKTTTMLKLLDGSPYEFMADDFCLVTPDGVVRSYPKPLTISQHTLHAVKSPLLRRRERMTLPLQSRLHSREGRRFAFLLAKSHLPVATVNQYVQLMVPPPKFHVDRLVPGVNIVDHADLAGMFVIQRGPRGLTFLESGDALDVLLANCEDAYGFPPYHRIEDFILAGGNQLRRREREIIAPALYGKPAAVLSSPTLDWARRIPTLMAQFESTRPRVDVFEDAVGSSSRASSAMCVDLRSDGSGENAGAPQL